MLVSLLCASLAFAALPQQSTAGKTVALKAGTARLVEDGKVVTGGVTLLMRDGKILAVGKDVAVPPGAEVIDYGPDAVLAPGLVSANSSYGVSFASPRTASPGTRAIDNVDFTSSVYLFDLAGGVTTAYVPPARGRLIAGQGCVIKLAGEDEERRVLSEAAALHGAISEEARATPGYWEVPVPATAQTGLGVEEPQLPRSLMGAMVALDELLEAARTRRGGEEYGAQTPAELAHWIDERKPWRLTAETEAEIRALAVWAKQQELPLVIDGAFEGAEVADAVAASQASVIVEVPIAPGKPGRDLGTDEDDSWPRYDTAARLMEAGVRTAIAVPESARPRDLRLAAALSRGLTEEAALRAVTLTPAEILGVSGRVGSLAPGKDADVAVFNGSPTEITSSVLATWVDGELAWKAPGSSSAVVLEVEELYVGDGKVMRPAQILMKDGRIVEVGERVGHPIGSRVVRGRAAMPGIVDAFGFLGLEGSSKLPAIDFKLARIVEPGDRLARRVAKSGVTTVVLAPRGPTFAGAPLMAYKPADRSLDRMVVEDPCAVRLTWSDKNNRLDSGKSVRQLLEKAVEYDKKWKAYDEALAKWTPAAAPPPEAEKKDEEKSGEEKKDEKPDESKKDEEKDHDAKKDEKEDKGKKKDAKAESDPLIGVWQAQVDASPFAGKEPLRLRLERNAKAVAGSLRCEPISSFLVLVAGTFEDDQLSLSGIGSRGWVTVDAKLADKKLAGKLSVGGTSVEFEAERALAELEVAARPERRRPKADEEEPKGKPKPPGVDEKLEPLRQALRGDVAIVVDVDREDEILACVAAFEGVGIQPVLVGATEAWRVKDKLRGRIGGVLLSGPVVRNDPRTGLQSAANVYAELAEAGLRIAFHSDAEEGAADLFVLAFYAVAEGLSPEVALRALTCDSADMLGLTARVGRIAPGLDADVLVLDGSPLDPGTSVLRAFVNGEEVQ